MTYYLIIAQANPTICLCTEHTWSRWSTDILSAFESFTAEPRITYRSATEGPQPFNKLFQLCKSQSDRYTVHRLELPTANFKLFKQHYPELLL